MKYNKFAQKRAKSKRAPKSDAEYFKKPMRFFGVNRLIPVLRPYKKTIILMLTAALLGSCFDIILPQFQKYAIDNFIGENTLNGFGVFIAVYVIFLVLQVLTNLVSVFAANSVEMNVDHKLREKCFVHLQELSFSYYNKNSVGYVHSRVMSDTSNIGDAVVWGMMEGVWHISYVVGVAVVMFIMNARLALLVVSILPIMCVAIIFFEKKLVTVNRKIRELNSKISGDFNEGITGAKTIKTLAIEDKMNGEFRTDTKNMKVFSVKSVRLKGIFWSIVSLSSSFCLAMVLWKGGHIALEDVKKVGMLSVFMTYAMNIADPIQWIVEVTANMISTKVNIERVTDLISEVPDVADSAEVIEKYGDSFEPKTENWEELRGDIEFCDVTFRYPDGEENVLEHFNLKIPFGTNVAIVGETGAGKSTLVNLICRFFEPTEGKILVDGKDLRERSQLWMHRSIGYVLQTPHLFSGTIAENLRYGNPDATDEEIMEALRLVGADKLVEGMKAGLDSSVGEGGDLLSTGEKQLISFARAVLVDPKILILDEATSSIDTLTEQKILEATAKVIKGRTSFVIAHRLSTVRGADIILVVRDGKIVESGTHSELLKKKGYYYDLQHSQYREDAEKKAFENS